MSIRLSSLLIKTTLLLSISCLIVGCAGLSLNKKASQINNDIHDKTATITKAATDAEASVDAADQKIVVATTQPGNPVKTTQLLTGAHGDLTKAKTSLAPIVPAAAVIEKKADAAVKVTETATAETEKAKNTIGYRVGAWIKSAFWTILITAFVIALVLGVIAFIVRTSGGGPIMQALGEIAGNILTAAWTAIKGIGKKAGTIALHTATLGSLKLADKVNQKYDEQQASIAAAATSTDTKSI